jgi:hypothetical protein
MPLLSGDRLKTIDGRVEVLFADGSALHMDSRTTIDLQSDELLRLIDGRLRLTIAGRGADARSASLVYRVDSPAGSVRITQPGDYRVSMLRRGDEVQLELAVIRGAGEIFTDEGATMVRAGERAYASAGLAPSYAYTHNSANWDAFDRWSESRRDTRSGVSTQYLPSEVRAYASTLDEEGDWRYEQSHGYVWYPRVDVNWRPYYYGRWARYPRFGWTWIGADRFAWPTHHYGRWGFSSGAWFWIPARRWAPAYVSWAYAPGYVSWCPLGFDNRPVFAINIFNVRPGYYSSWRAWTAVGYTHFGRDYVHRRAVDWTRFDRGRRPSFQIAQSAPAVRDVAVPRGSTAAQGRLRDVERGSSPIRWAGARTLPPASGSTAARGTAAAVERSERSAASGISNAPRYINRGDAIVRSRSGRPSAPAERMPDFGAAVPRTAPAGPARRSDAPATPSAPAAEADRARPMPGTRPEFAPRSPYERGRAMPRVDAPVYQPPAPAYQGYDGRAVPRSSTRPPGDPASAYGRSAPPHAGAPNRESAAPAGPDSGPRGYAAPRGGFDARPAPAAPAAPAGGGARQGPTPRAGAPQPSAPSGDRAVPRNPGGPAPAAPAGSGGRSRGRGGS